MKKILSFLLAVLLVVAPVAVSAAEETEVIEIVMEDTYGDGWDGFMLKICQVNDDGTETLLEQDITIEDGRSGTFQMTVAKHAVVRIYCQSPGLYAYEHSFKVIRAGVTIFTYDGDTVTAGQLLLTTNHPDAREASIAYDVDPAYTVTIPATVTLGQTVTIAVEDVLIDRNTYVSLAIAAASGENNTFTLENETGNTLLYTVTASGTQVSVGDELLGVAPGENCSGSTELAFALAQDIKYSGTYTGTVTFAISVKATSEKTFNFLIGDKQYQAKENMTWDMWVNSAYNPNGIWQWEEEYGILQSNEVKEGYLAVVFNPEYDDYDDTVGKEDEIQENAAYSLVVFGEEM